MRYALNLPAAGPCGDPRTLAELAALAEQSGWDAVFLEDYLVYQNQQGTPTYDPWVCLAAMAVSTHHVRLGTTVTPVPRRRVQKLAAECVSIDHLSNGRLTLGVGIGDSWDASLAAFGDGRTPAERAAYLDEALEALVGLWSGEVFSSHGTYVHIDSVRTMPTPVQQPRIPIWVGGLFPKRGPMQRAARWDGSCLWKAESYGPEGGISADWTADDVRALRQAIGPGKDIVVGGSERKQDSAAERALIGELERAGATWWTEWIPPGERATVQPAISRGPLRAED